MSDEFQLAVPKPPDFDSMPLEKTAQGHVFTPFFGFTDPAISEMAVKQGYGGSIYQSFRARAVTAFALALNIDESSVFVSQRTVPFLSLQDGAIGQELTAPAANEPMQIRNSRAPGIIEWRLGTARACETPAERRSRVSREKAAAGSISEGRACSEVSTVPDAQPIEAEVAPEYQVKRFRKETAVQTHAAETIDVQ